jgi:hypothetical protein
MEKDIAEGLEFVPKMHSSALVIEKESVKCRRRGAQQRRQLRAVWTR